MRHVLLAAALTLLLPTAGAEAASCVTDYQVNVSIVDPASLTTPPATATVTGNVCTDGTLGTLAQNNIVSWKLTLANSWTPGIVPFTLDSSVSGNTMRLALSGVASPLSATATDLSWNFADPGSGNYATLTFEDTTSTNFIAWNNQYFSSALTDYSYGAFNNAASYGSTLSGPIVFGTTVPEPLSTALLGSGLACLIAVRRRRHG